MKNKSFLKKGIDGKWHWYYKGPLDGDLIVPEVGGGINYNTKPVIIINGDIYDLEVSKEGEYFVTTPEGTVRIYEVVDKNDSSKKSYTYENPVTFVPGGDENTNYIQGKANYSSDSFIQKKNDAEEDYQKKVQDHSEAEGAYNQAKKKADELEKKFEDWDKAQDEFDEGDLGSLANLPRNIGDLFNGMNEEQMKDTQKLLEDMLKNGGEIDLLHWLKSY